MKKETLHRLAALSMALLLLLTAVGCSSSSSSEPEPEDPIYPLTIKGVEIIVGETKVQALLDAGMEISWSEMDSNNQITQYTVDSSTMLDPMSYYTGQSVWITDRIFAHVSFVTDEEAVTLGEATIAYVDIYFTSDEAENKAANVTFNGVPSGDLTREKAGEMFPDFSGDDNMWFSSALKIRNYKYGLYYSQGALHEITVERKYDVDWNG